jgi:hypothetical protein
MAASQLLDLLRNQLRIKHQENLRIYVGNDQNSKKIQEFACDPHM